ncbi:MAG: FAD:protein FMN transferase [Treponema sp.]|nr:FAD:protein FMN transferase [Treponema sp.]
MKKIAILVFCLFVFVSCAQNSNFIAFDSMNTFMTLKTYGRNAAKANLKVKARICELESYFSTTLKESDVYKINHSNGDFEFLHDETARLALYAFEMAKKTDGALNPAIYPIVRAWGFTTGEYKIPSETEILSILPYADFSKVQIEKITNPENTEKSAEKIILHKQDEMMIDFGAVAKGFASDEAVKILKAYGIGSAILDLGGNIVALGTKPDGTEWNVGIKNPWNGENPVAGIKIKNQCVVTSGGYERFFVGEDGKKYIHIFDEKTGFPVENELESVSVISESGIYADSLSTALFVMGTEKAIDFWKSNRDFDMILITKDKRIFFTKSINEKISVLYDFAEKICVE